MSLIFELLATYREKRCVDGLNGRIWDAMRHHAADAKIDGLERALRERIERTLPPDQCPSCGRSEAEHDGTERLGCLVFWPHGEPVESWEYRNEIAHAKAEDDRFQRSRGRDRV